MRHIKVDIWRNVHDLCRILHWHKGLIYAEVCTIFAEVCIEKTISPASMNRDQWQMVWTEIQLSDLCLHCLQRKLYIIFLVQYLLTDQIIYEFLNLGICFFFWRVEYPFVYIYFLADQNLHEMSWVVTACLWYWNIFWHNHHFISYHICISVKIHQLLVIFTHWMFKLSYFMML